MQELYKVHVSPSKDYVSNLQWENHAVWSCEKGTLEHNHAPCPWPPQDPQLIQCGHVKECLNAIMHLATDHLRIPSWFVSLLDFDLESESTEGLESPSVMGQIERSIFSIYSTLFRLVWTWEAWPSDELPENLSEKFLGKLFPKLNASCDMR